MKSRYTFTCGLVLALMALAVPEQRVLAQTNCSFCITCPTDPEKSTWDDNHATLYPVITPIGGPTCETLDCPGYIECPPDEDYDFDTLVELVDRGDIAGLRTFVAKLEDSVELIGARNALVVRSSCGAMVAFVALPTREMFVSLSQ